MCSNICNKNSNDTVHLDSPPIVQVAIQQQLKLGPNFLLQGYLVPEWLAAIQHFDRNKPQLRLTHLYLGLWKTLFSAVWEQRNDTANSDFSFVEKIKRHQFACELIEWKQERHTRLSSSQHYLVGYDITSMKEWSLSNMRVTLELLVQAACNSRRSFTTRQHLITEFFQPT